MTIVQSKTSALLNGGLQPKIAKAHPEMESLNLKLRDAEGLLAAAGREVAAVEANLARPRPTWP